MKLETIYGPPGTGKTSELISIAKREADTGQRVLYLSYTRAGAEEAAGRANDKIVCATIHSTAFRKLGLGRASVVTAATLREFEKASGIPFRGVDDNEDLEGDEYKSVYSYATNRIIPMEEAYDHFGRPGTHDRFKMFVNAYESYKKEYGYKDFDDMLALASKQRFSGFPVVILDEAQDCSPLQWATFHAVVKNAARVYIAGDDDQAIYEWSGADPHGMVGFTDWYSGGVSRVLERSYRVPLQVWELAHSLALDEIKTRVTKTFSPRKGNGQITEYGDISNAPLRDLAGKDAMVLCRDAWRLKEAQRLLHADKIPYRMNNGRSPWENKYAVAWKKGDRSEVPAYLHDFYESLDLDLPLTVLLSTVHQAKGREAETVVVDLTMPARVEAGVYRDRDAELRVLYVSLTRAKENLWLCGSNPLT